jgi:hypothetical protein
MKQRLLVIASTAIRKHAGSLAKTSAIPQMQSQTHWPTSFDGSSKLDYGIAQPHKRIFIILELALSFLQEYIKALWMADLFKGEMANEWVAPGTLSETGRRQSR